jgi:hypothetical protein
MHFAPIKSNMWVITLYYEVQTARRMAAVILFKYQNITNNHVSFIADPTDPSFNRAFFTTETNMIQQSSEGKMGLTDGGDGGDDLAELELVEDGGFTGGVEADHEDPHLLLGEEPAEELPEREPHLPPRPPSFTPAEPSTGHSFIPRSDLPPQTLAYNGSQIPQRIQATAPRIWTEMIQPQSRGSVG